MVVSKSNITSSKASSNTLPQQPAIPAKATASVTRVKITSDYLRGRAASIQETAKSHHEAILRSNQSSQRRPRSLASRAEALDNARRSLLCEFRQFESDATAWAVYIRKGYKQGRGRNATRVPCPNEARQILLAVNEARKEVYPAMRTSPRPPQPQKKTKDVQGKRKGNGGRDWNICGLFCFSSE